MLNSRTNTTIGVSPFFLYHSYHNTPFPQPQTVTQANEVGEAAKDIVRTISNAAN